MKDRKTWILPAGGVLPIREIPEPTLYPPGTPIDVMLDAPVHGNAYSDGPLNVALLKYAINEENPINKRRAAVAKIDVIVGSDKEEGSDQQVVDRFMKQMGPYLEEMKEEHADENEDLFFDAEIDDE